MVRIAVFRRVVGAGLALALGAAMGRGAEVTAAQLQEVLEQILRGEGYSVETVVGGRRSG